MRHSNSCSVTNSKVKEKNEKVGLKLNIQKTKMMVPSLHGK